MIGLGLGSQPTTECDIFGSYQSLNLDGNSDYVSLPEDIKSVINLGATTVSCWVNIVQNDGNNTQVIMKIFTDTDNQFQLLYHKHNTEFRATLKTGGGTNRIATYDPPGGSTGYTGWQHFAATFRISGGSYSLVLYRNGAKIEEIRGVSGQADWVGIIDTINVGANQTGSAAFTDGQLDQLALYNIQLEDAGIAEIYNGGVMRDLTVSHSTFGPSNLIGYYQFEGNALDSSNTKAHGTLNGTAGFSTNQP